MRSRYWLPVMGAWWSGLREAVASVLRRACYGERVEASELRRASGGVRVAACVLRRAGCGERRSERQAELRCCGGGLAGGGRAFDRALGEQARAGDVDGLGAEVVASEVAAVARGGDADRARAGEWIDDELVRVGRLADQGLGDLGRLFRRVAVRDALLLEDVGDAEVVALALALLEEQHALVARAVVVAHADRAVVRDHAVREQEQLVRVIDRDVDQVLEADVFDRGHGGWFEADRARDQLDLEAELSGAGQLDRARAQARAGAQGGGLDQGAVRTQEAVLARGDQVGAVREREAERGRARAARGAADGGAAFRDRDALARIALGDREDAAIRPHEGLGAEALVPDQRLPELEA